jgi:hypothetical protein
MEAQIHFAINVDKWLDFGFIARPALILWLRLSKQKFSELFSLYAQEISLRRNSSHTLHISPSLGTNSGAALRHRFRGLPSAFVEFDR